MNNALKTIIYKTGADVLFREARQLFGGKKYFCPVCQNHIYRFQGLSERYFEQWMEHRYIHRALV